MKMRELVYLIAELGTHSEDKLFLCRLGYVTVNMVKQYIWIFLMRRDSSRGKIWYILLGNKMCYKTPKKEFKLSVWCTTGLSTTVL